MAENVADREQLVERLTEREELTPATRAALLSVKRHEFVPPDRRDMAYHDRPLPIGAGQTISAPHMVAIMADHLAVGPGDTVLEIGTGCGYHAAVTAELVGDGHVFSVEYHPELAREARARLARLGYEVAIRTGDGHAGWPTHAPYDAAYLTCATPSVPDAIVDQTAPGGRILAPVGRRRQTLVELRVDDTGVAEQIDHGGVRFVRMRGG